MVEAAGNAKPPREQDGQGNLVQLRRLPVGRAIERPVLVPATVRALVRLQVTERAQRGVAVARVE